MSFKSYYEIIVDDTQESGLYCLWLLLAADGRLRLVLCLFTLKGFTATLSKPADVKPLILQVGSVLCICFTLSAPGAINCYSIQRNILGQGELSFIGHTENHNCGWITPSSTTCFWFWSFTLVFHHQQPTVTSDFFFGQLDPLRQIYF